MRYIVTFMTVCLCSLVLAEPSIKPTPPSSQPTAHAQTTLPVEITSDDPNLYYVGRFDRSGKGVRAQWGGSSVTIRFNGTDLQAKLGDTGNTYHTVVVNGEVKSVLTVRGKAGVFDLARDLPAGEHTVSLVRRVEPSQGMSIYQGFYLNEGGRLLEPKKLTRRIEIIGDSISCGYGNDTLDPKQKFSPQTQNAWNTYGAIAGRALDAEVHLLAWSGRKVTNSLDIYTRTLPTDAKSEHTPGNWKADVVLINLCTNDFAGKNEPEEEAWVKAYKDLVAQVRKNHPDAQLYLASGPMFTVGDQGKGLTFQNYLNRVQKELEAAGDKKIKQLHFDRQNAGKDGVGADWHPSAATHAKMAEKLTTAIKQDLNW
jgi:lysophospholipase L1-like esterase